MGREKNNNDVLVCERVCTSKRMLIKVGAFSKDPVADTCVTVCGVSELDACDRDDIDGRRFQMIMTNGGRRFQMIIPNGARQTNK